MAKVLISGYYGFGNAGDEAVLAAILQHMSERRPGLQFIAASGNPQNTVQLHSSAEKKYFLQAVQRNHFRELAAAIKSCDLFISGGGSLLQDITSLRNAAYHCGLLRLAQFWRKPTMIYAQGVGPLRQSLSQKLTRAAVSRAKAITVRDEASKVLLQHLGVKKPIQVTADPVWGLANSAAQEITAPKTPVWGISLRSWPGLLESDSRTRVASTLAVLRDLSMRQGTQLRFISMQSGVDDVLLSSLGADSAHYLSAKSKHPLDIMNGIRKCDVVIAMRLHALIFAASQDIPCVAINYDPKVAAIAKHLHIPLLEETDCSRLDKLAAAISAAKPPNEEKINALAVAARQNAAIAVGLLRR